MSKELEANEQKMVLLVRSNCTRQFVRQNERTFLIQLFGVPPSRGARLLCVSQARQQAFICGLFAC